MIKKFSSAFLAIIICFVSISVNYESYIINVNAASNEQIIYNFLRNDMGYNVAVSCGILANIKAESSFNPTAVGDGGTSYGICQWHNSRKQNLINYCNNNGYDYTTLIGQLQFMKYEMINSPQDTGSIYTKLKKYNTDDYNNSDGAYWSGYDWCYYNERPANKGSVSISRGNLAKNTYWSKYNTTLNYTVWLNANGGNVNPGSITVQTNGTYSELPTPYRSGYNFAGWFDEGGRQVWDGVGIYTNGDHTLYARWNPIPYTVWLDTGGSITVYTDGTYDGLPTPDRYGYDFAGWFDDSGRQVWDGVEIYTNSDHTLYACWNPKSITVNLNATGGSVSSSSIQVNFDNKYSNLPSAEKPGYNFNGWFTASDGGTQVDFNSVCNTVDEHTLFAHWDKNKIMITFNAIGGTVETANKLVVYDNKYGVLPTPEKKGYEFKGWYLDESYTKPITKDTIVDVTGNKTVYAKWNIRQFVITFDAGKGTLDVENKRVVFGKAYGVLPEATLGEEVFLGWFTADGNEITSESIVELEEDTVLYARWRVQGDVNADGVFDAQDVIMVQDWLLAKPDATLSDWRAADVCKDERIDVFDLCLLRQLLMEVIQ